MANLCDSIEEHLKERLRGAPGGIVELQRSELAERFQCVPSQINYVLATRFSAERGYTVESRRGGGGFIRIIRLNLEGQRDLHHWVAERIGQAVSQDEARSYVFRLLDNGVINQREAALMQAAVDRQVLALDLPLRDMIRANLLRAMLLVILRF